MSRGKRYEEPKLNLKKVFAVIIAIIVILMCIFIIKGILTKDEQNQGRITSKNYLVAFQNNKFGVIDSNGEIVIDPSYEEIIIIPNQKNDVFLCTYDVNYDTGEYKTKALNNKNQEIFTQYEQIEAISNKDENQNLWYEQNVLKVKKDGKYGLINMQGQEVLSCSYDEINVIENVEDVLLVKQNELYGVVNTSGKEIVKAEYTNIENLGKDYTQGFIVQKDQKYGVVDSQGNVVLQPIYEGIEKIYGNDMYVVIQQGKQQIVNKEGTEVLTKGFDEIEQILRNPENGVIYKQKDKYGVMKTTGEVTIEPVYEELKETKTGILIAKQNEKYGVIDIEKNEKLPFSYTSISYYDQADIYVVEKEDFSNDIIDNTFNVKKTGILINIDEEKGYMELRQNDEYKFYNFKFEEKSEKDIFSTNTIFLSKKDGKYGFVDKDGKVIVDYNYDDATQVNSYGYAGIKKDGKWGSIDSKGNIIQEPIYNLDEYLKIDFVGRWHFGKDINMNYYNQL